MKARMKATIDIRIGNDFNYHFSNQEENVQMKKLSPSQRKQNFERKLDFQEKKIVERKHYDNILEKKESKDAETQTESEEVIEKQDSESQTTIIPLETVGTNTDEAEIETLENILEVDKNGHIQPRLSESLVEMKVNHNAKDWKQIETHIKENLKLPLIGNGDWKLRTFNWQDSGITSVSSSRLYR